MAIVKNKNVKAADAAPVFEQESETAAAETVAAVTRADVADLKPAETAKAEVTAKVTSEVVVEVKSEPVINDAQNAQESEVTEPVEVKKTAVIARNQSGAMKTILNSSSGAPSPLDDLENAFAKAGIETDYGTFPRLRLDAGVIASTEGNEAGTFIELQVISYSPSWTVATGTEGKEGKEHVRFSDDGKVTNSAGEKDEYAGTPLEEYRQILVDKGFEKASIKEYTAVFGIALDAQLPDFAHMNEVVSVSLAPESRKKFDSYKVNRKIAARMGKVQETSGNPVVRFTSVRVTGKERSYFNLLASHGVTAPVDLA